MMNLKHQTGRQGRSHVTFRGLREMRKNLNLRSLISEICRLNHSSGMISEKSARFIAVQTVFRKLRFDTTVKPPWSPKAFILFYSENIEVKLLSSGLISETLGLCTAPKSAPRSLQSRIPLNRSVIKCSDIHPPLHG